MKKRILSILAYMLPTFPLGYFWHLTIFADYYHSLHVYRDELIIPFDIASMLIQGLIWSVIYERLFAGESILKGAVKFAALACPLDMELHGARCERQTPHVFCQRFFAD